MGKLQIIKQTIMFLSTGRSNAVNMRHLHRLRRQQCKVPGESRDRGLLRSCTCGTSCFLAWLEGRRYHGLGMKNPPKGS
jgi:hypothetical protein